MATINGLTAERMQEIIDKTIVDADVVGDDLILTLHDATTINAGNVRGPEGDPGVADVAAQIANVLNLADPVGTPKPYTGAVAPAGHGLCDAATEYSSATYPLLAVLYGTGPGCVNGASTAGTFRLPNFKGKVLVGRDAAVAAFSDLHEIGGSKDAVVIQHTHPSTAEQDQHIHEMEHQHGAQAGGSNQIALTNGLVAEVAAGTDYLAINNMTGGTTGASPDALTGPADQVITVTTPNPVGSVSGTDKNLQPYRVVNYIMRLA